jgi:hypothetical protein
MIDDVCIDWNIEALGHLVILGSSKSLNESFEHRDGVGHFVCSADAVSQADEQGLPDTRVAQRIAGQYGNGDNTI